MTRRVLVVAYSFPPCSVTGTFRTLGFVKYLDALGWQATVLSTENPANLERDDRLLAQVPPGTSVIRTRDRDLLAWRDRLRGRRSTILLEDTRANGRATWKPLRKLKLSIARRLRPFNHSPGWYRTTVRAGDEELDRGGYELIFSSGPPWTGHRIANALASRYDLPWVADFRDPWLRNPFLPSDRHLQSLDAREEARTLARADRVVTVLETMRRDFLTRYPFRSADSVVTIPNGFDPANLVGRPANESAGSPDHPLVLLHAGQIYGRRRIEPLLDGIAETMQGSAEVPLVLELLGGDLGHAAAMHEKVDVAGVRPWVTVEPEIPHAEAWTRMARASVLVLVGYAGAGQEFQMSGKIFEYLAQRRPVFALAPPECPVGDVLRQSGVRHWIVSPDDPAGIRAALADLVVSWKRGDLRGPQGTTDLTPFDRKAQAGQLAEVFEAAIAARAGSAAREKS